VQQLFALAFQHLVHGDSGPARHHAGDMLGRHRFAGQGGVLAGAEAIFGALGSGKAFENPANFLTTAIAAVNTYQNAKSLTSAGVRSELTGAAIRGLQSAAVIGLSGQNTISFPVNNPSATTSAKPIQFNGGNGP